MRVPLAWLRSYCDPALSAEEIAARLSLGGLEVARIEHAGVAEPDAFVVGRVLTADRHPNADRLSVCTVDDGSPEPRTIVCGAPNVAAGQTVAVARPGARMLDGSTLGEAELRGVRSSGMILAEDELGIGEDHSGIVVLADGPAPGAPLLDVLPIADSVLDVEVNPNRPDALAVYGVARDLHALTAAPLAEDPSAPDAEPGGGAAEDHASVEIADPDVCLRFTARVFEEVTIGESPPWLKQRLTAAGQRPISNVVDVTNYVMLVTGQPLHAFDLDRVRGGRIVVRRAREGERMTTLDGVERALAPDMALVCDAEGPSGIAGIMGGQVSEVSERTTRVLMEAATWVGPNILGSSTALGLRTEASARFEKQLHPDTALAAQRLAARLMVELCGARMAAGTLDAYPRPAEPREVGLRLGRLEGLLGERIPADEVRAILTRLGFQPAGDGERLTTTVPYWRDADVRREADLIEEVVRIHGLDKLPSTLPARRRAVGRLTPAQRLRRRVEDTLRDRGASEAVAYSFTAPAALAALRVDDPSVVRLTNPLSEDQSVMRPLLLPGLLDALRHNVSHDRTELSLFESAHVYRAANGSAGPALEAHHLGALTTVAAPEGWRSEPRAADYYAARALLEAVMGAVGVEWSAAAVGSSAAAPARPFLHPGRAASVLGPAARELGWVGELHPLVARAWELGERPVAGFEVDLDALVELAGEGESYRDVTSFPAVHQDIAVVVPEGVSAAEVERAVRSGGGALLERPVVFDLYRGAQLGEGMKSLALRLEFRAPDRTLTDDEVAERRAAIEAELAGLGGRLRA